MKRYWPFFHKAGNKNRRHNLHRGPHHAYRSSHQSFKAFEGWMLLPLLLLGVVYSFGAGLWQQWGPWGGSGMLETPFTMQLGQLINEMAGQPTLLKQGPGQILGQAITQYAGFWQAPGFICLGATLVGLFGGQAQAARWIPIVFGVGTLYFTLVLGRHWFGDKRIGAIAALLLATSFGFWRATTTLSPDLAVALLCLLTVALLAEACNRFAQGELNAGQRLGLSFGTGLLTGLMALFNGAETWIGLILGFLIAVQFLANVAWRAWISPKAFGIGFFVFPMAWVAWIVVSAASQQSQAFWGQWLWQFLAQGPWQRLALSAKILYQQGVWSGLWVAGIGVVVASLPWPLVGLAMLVRERTLRGTTRMLAWTHPPTAMLVGCTVSTVLMGFVAPVVSPVVVLPALCLLMAKGIVIALDSPNQSLALRGAADATALLMLAGALYLTLVIFQTLPDAYPEADWPFWGTPQFILLWEETPLTQPFALWKVALLPFPLLLLVAGLATLIARSAQRSGWFVGIIALCSLLGYGLFSGLVPPLFDRPVVSGPRQSHLLAKASAYAQSSATGLWVLSTSRHLPVPLARLVYALPARGSLTGPHPPILPRPLSTPLRQGTGLLMMEADYYQLPPQNRLKLRIIATDWVWKPDALQAALPFSGSGQANSVLSPHGLRRFREYLLLAEPALTDAQDAPFTPALTAF